MNQQNKPAGTNPGRSRREALGLSDSLKIQSLDDSSDEQRALQETLGNDDPELYAVVEHAPLYEALDSLEQRQQMIMRRRYFDLWSQAKVAGDWAEQADWHELGCNQDHYAERHGQHAAPGRVSDIFGYAE